MELISTNNYSGNQSLEKIRQIERYGGNFDPNSSLSLDDQLFICESLSDEQHITDVQEKEEIKESVSVKWNASDTHKHDASISQAETKRNAIKKLKAFDYKTPPIEIAKELEILFTDYASNQGHWLYIAQNWNPRAINRVIERIIKLHSSGRKTIKNPPAYFTYLIKMRKRRRGL